MNRPPKREAAKKAREAIKQIALEDSSVPTDFSSTRPNQAEAPFFHYFSILTQNTMENTSRDDNSDVPSQGNEELGNVSQNLEGSGAQNVQNQSRNLGQSTQSQTMEVSRQPNKSFVRRFFSASLPLGISDPPKSEDPTSPAPRPDFDHSVTLAPTSAPKSSKSAFGPVSSSSPSC